MKVLVVGSGGREHALAWALARSPRVHQLFAAPGNGGTGTIATNVSIQSEDVSGLVRFAQDEQIDLVVIGPEGPLALGLSDALGAAGVRAFGPNAAAARLESSKAFSKDFMRTHGIPTADYALFSDYEQARDYLRNHPAPIVVKASGLAAGKGAIVCHTDEEARAALDAILRQRLFGAAGDVVVLEECLVGQEVSVLAFCDGHTVIPMLLAQDHKAIHDGDLGPNTGGMGAYAPAPLLSPAMLQRVQEQVLQRAVDGLHAQGTPYVGVLYAGLMVSGESFRVLEYNCRFGDPETQALLPLLETDLAEVLGACVDGTLDRVPLRWSDGASVCIVMAAKGYPGTYERGAIIEGLDAVDSLGNVAVFHAGTRHSAGETLTAGGRVLGVTAWADTLPSAIQRAYEAVELIHWPGAHYRHDIGAKGLERNEE